MVNNDQGLLVGGDWNHGIFTDFPIILGMSIHPN
jgi:hypothetical protein